MTKKKKPMTKKKIPQKIKELSGYYECIFRLPLLADMTRTGKLTTLDNKFFYNGREVDKDIKVEVLAGEFKPTYLFIVPTTELARKLLDVGIVKKEKITIW